MIRRFVEGMKQRDSRRFFFTYLAGKMVGTIAVLAVIGGLAWYFGGHAGAQETTETPQVAVEALTNVINPINTMWVCVSCYFCTTRCPQDIPITDVIGTGFILFGRALMEGKGRMAMIGVLLLVAMLSGVQIVRRKFAKRDAGDAAKS